MATSKREVRLDLVTGVEGEEEVKALGNDLRQLAKAGGDAAPELQRLANELDASNAATKKLQAVQKELVRSYAQEKAAIQQRTDAQRRAAIETDAATKKTAEYKAQVQAERLALHDAGIALRQKKEALAAATAATEAASAAEQRLAAQAREVVKSTKGAEAAVGGLGTAAGEAVGMLSRLGPLMVGAFGAREIVGAIASNQQLALSYGAIFGGAERAAQEMAFVRDLANRLGVENQALARSYQSLAAATKGTALEGAATREVFEAVSKSMSVLGKSTAEIDRALAAISQMASKGTVSMEELRGQLGEALPGALQAAANGAGITTQQLIAMVESGSVLARDLLPALTAGLNDLYKGAAPPETIISAWARLQNSVRDTAVAVGEGGAGGAITKGLTWLSLGVRGVNNAFEVAGVGLGEFIAAVQTGNFDLQRAGELNAKYDKELRQAAEDAGLIAKSQDAATAATQASVRAIDNAVEANQRHATSTLAVRAQYSELMTGAAEYTKSVEKSLAARQAESATLLKLTNIYGTELERRQAAVRAVEVEAAGLRDLAKARDAEAIVAQSLSIRLQEEALRRRDTSEATQKEIAAAQATAAAKRSEADQSEALSASKRIEVAAAEAAAEALTDNSGRLWELKAASAAAADEVDRLTAAQAKGAATADQVAEAQARAAKATALMRDAQRDAARRDEETRRQALGWQGREFGHRLGGRNPDGSYRDNADSLGIIGPNQDVRSTINQGLDLSKGTNTLPIDKAAEVLLKGAAAFTAADIDYLKEAKAQAVAARQQLDAMQKLSAGSVSTQAIRDANAMLAATTAALSRATQQQQREAVSNSVKTVTVNINGKKTPINVVGDEDSNALVSVLRRLEEAAGTAQ